MNPSTASITTPTQALSALQSTEKSAQDPTAILQAQDQSLGVPTAQQTVTGLQGALNSTTKLLQQVAPSVMGRTQNSLVTSAQADKQISNEQAPLNTTISNDTTQYNQANQNLTNLQNQAQTAATGIYQGQQDQESYLQNLYTALFGQQQDAEKEADTKAALAEQAREANLSAANSGVAGPTLNIGGSTPTPSSSSGYGYGLKDGSSGSGGYYFQGPTGSPISAFQYAQATGNNFVTLVQKMAASGDAGAKEILPYVTTKGIAANYAKANPSLYDAFMGTHTAVTSGGVNLGQVGGAPQGIKI